MIKKEEKDI
ncbi:hypothetical protein BDFB_013285 [Asbolus verrucosus]|uniref:Uncharacterized protein n=1 Tax=Asbolus verrucosus TaxID=1661398 RepID=A0A482V953_ASBVE|nr:hypothetical protein BDFB_013285 [Asbolus verrucosus]